MPRTATFGGALPIFFLGHSVQLLPVRDHPAEAAQAAASLVTATFCGALPIFFLGHNVQLLPVRDHPAEAAQAAASLVTALDTAAG